MLILTRRRDESIVIGEGNDAVTVKVVKITGNYVTIAFDTKANRERMPIVRSEVLERKGDSNGPGRDVRVQRNGC